MAQSLARIILPIIFSTKNREPFLADTTIRSVMHAYIAGICDRCESHAHLVGGVADHAHILCSLSRNITVADLVKEIKKDSSKWVKGKDSRLTKFHWQSGYGAFSVSQSHLSQVRAYIADQEEHHRHRTFQEEFREFLRRYEIEFDERYVWD